MNDTERITQLMAALLVARAEVAKQLTWNRATSKVLDIIDAALRAAEEKP